MPKISNERKNQRKGQILHAAFQCFVEKGYEQTTMREIFDRAGLSAGAVYLYFKGKKEIIQSLANAGKWHFERIVKEIDKSDNPLRDVLRRLAFLIDKKGGAKGIQLEITLLAASLNDNTLRKILLNKLQHDIAVVESLLQKSSSNISMDETAVARIIIGAIQGLSIQKMIDPGFSMQKVVKGYHM